VKPSSIEVERLRDQYLVSHEEEEPGRLAA
jgi:hypothetical protein